VTSAQTAAFASLVISLAVLFLLVILGIPRLARLVFVHRIEVIRDACMDAILDDQIRETSSVRRFVQVTETGAELPHLLTLPRLFALSKAMVDVGIDVSHVASAHTYADLPAAQRGVMLELDDRLCKAYASYLNWGSPAGFVLRPLGALMSRIQPGSAFAKAEDAVPAVARETLAQPSRRNLSYGNFAGR
jgi:hypothetical protein